MRRMRSLVRHRSAVVLALVALLAAPTAASAHATLLSADPAPGSTVGTAPTRVSATFDEELDGAKSSIVLVGPDGGTLGQGSIDPDDPKTLALDVAPLEPGTYSVRWTAATPDGHIERGTYEFAVAAPPTPSTSPEPRPTPSASPEPSPTVEPDADPSPTPAPEDGTDGDQGVAIIVVAAVSGLVLGVLIGWGRRRRRR